MPAALTVWSAFDLITNSAIATVAASSQRVYAQTFNAWAQWCEEHGVSPTDLRQNNVLNFLRSKDITNGTRQRQMSALRKLAQMMMVGNPTDARLKGIYEVLKMTRVPKSAGGKSRERRALPLDDVTAILNVWSGGTLMDYRNRALIALLFATGLRRSEIAALRWDDIDLTEMILRVRHGKGDKTREVAIIGEFSAHPLLDWRSLATGRIFVFCQITPKGTLGKDKAMNAQAVYRAVKHTEKISGVKFSPHDARRTLITEALANSTPMADVQAQAGHAQASTTMRYAMPVDARLRRDKMKVRYGQ
jgi:integrase